jgi:cyclophilin family peptidyl-prolyl cis-trans isomerase/HEAT repeat protein
MLRRFAAASLLLAAGCGSSDERPEPASQPTVVLPGSRGAALALVTSRELEEVARLEDARSLGDGRLLELLTAERDARVRERAALALGRFPYPRFGDDVTAALVRALEDPELEVRLAVAFALGMRGDPSSAGTLLAYRNDPEARLRARVVEAASRLPGPAEHAQLVLSLRDADLSVRMEAAVGTARWPRDERGASEVDRALLDALSPYRITKEPAAKSAVEAELVWRILWALGRRKSELGRGPFLEYARSEIVLERLFALRGLAQLAPDEPSVRAVVTALVGPSATRDWRIAYEACVALRSFGDAEEGRLDAKTSALLTGEEPLAALEAAAEHASPHVRAGAVEALTGFGDGRRVLALLQRGRLDLSVGVRAATLRARVRGSTPDDALAALERGAKEDDPVLRAAAAEAAAELRDERASGVLIELARDPSLLVATRAVEALGKHPNEAVRAALHGTLAHPDNGMRLGAALALKEMPDPSDVPALAQAVTDSSGEGAAEVAFTALQALGAIGTGDARAAVEAAQADPRPHVRAVAKQLVRETFGGTPSADEPAFEPGRGVPVAGKDYPLWRFNPLVELTTARGTLSFELFPAEAPIHVFNFLQLVERGAYDGLTFHRVVPNFVVQGGDHRGDGNGAIPWDGEALRAEFTPRKSTRGSLGMPRNEDPDSGGSQFFVTHLPTPHLDGRYTFFGELRTGGEVLDRLEVGDRILSARLVP